MTPQFSIIIPTHNRADGRLQRALDSIVVQTHRDFECIVVDDGSTDGTYKVVLEYLIHDRRQQMEMETPVKLDLPEHCAEHLRGGRFHYVRHEKNQGRVVARNTGMNASVGNWLLWTDSDDALDQMYLASAAYHIEQEPSARVFIVGAITHGMATRMEGKEKIHICPVWTKIRQCWIPPVNSDGVHDHFNSGKIGSGSFIFARECYEHIGPMPPWKTCYDIADGCNEWLEYETPYSARKKWCGNPFGDDWVYVRRLSQFYLFHPIHAALYIQYIR